MLTKTKCLSNEENNLHWIMIIRKLSSRLIKIIVKFRFRDDFNLDINLAKKKQQAIKI